MRQVWISRRFSVLLVSCLLTLSLLAQSSSVVAKRTQQHARLPRSSIHIAMVLKTLSNPFWVTMRQGAMAEAARLGVHLVVQAAPQESSISTQADILTSLESHHFSAYVVAPITPENLLPALRPVSSAHIPIIDLDAPVNFTQARKLGIHIVTYISSNNIHAGRLAGGYMVRLLHGHGQVAIIQGLAGDPTSLARASGFAAVAKAGGLRVVANLPADWDREKALNAATQVLAAHPAVRGFYAANDDMGLGVEKAVQNAHKQGQVFVISTDGIIQALRAIKAHQYAGTVSQYPYEEGVLGVDAAVVTLEGHPVPRRITSPVKLITPANVERALRVFPKPFFHFPDPLAKWVH